MNALQTLDVAATATPLRQPLHDDARVAFADGLGIGFRHGVVATIAWLAMLAACVALALLGAGVWP